MRSDWGRGLRSAAPERALALGPRDSHRPRHCASSRILFPAIGLRLDNNGTRSRKVLMPAVNYHSISGFSEDIHGIHVTST